MPRQNRGIERLKTEVNRSSPDAYDVTDLPIETISTLPKNLFCLKRA